MLKTISFLLKFIFPSHCIQCKTEGDFLCKSCEEKYFVTNKKQVCPISYLPSVHGRTLDNYKNKTSLDGLLVLSSYKKNNILQKLLKKLKYYFAFDIANTLGNILNKFLNQQGFPKKEFCITYVPLHWKRKSYRVFNQSKLLSEKIGETKKLLNRVKHTPQQAKLNRNERLNNLKNAFEFVGKEMPEKVLIVDDVASTCTTLNECAKVLKASGAKEVWGIVLARNI